LTISGKKFRNWKSELINIYYGDEENIPIGGGIVIYIEDDERVSLVLEIKRVEREKEDLLDEYNNVVEEMTTPAQAVPPNMSIPSFEEYIDALSDSEKGVVEVEEYETEVEGDNFSIKIYSDWII